LFRSQLAANRVRWVLVQPLSRCRFKMKLLLKIDELSALSNPNIIRPQDIVIDRSSRPVGFTMRYIKNALQPLDEILTTNFICQQFS